MISSAPTNYVIARKPNMYGGKQEDFQIKCEESIAKALVLVKTAVKEKHDLKKLFFIILNDFIKARHDIAVAHKTPDATLFGQRRLDNLADVNYTAMGDQYVDFNKRMMLRLQRYLKGVIPIKGDPKQKKLQFEESYQGKNCSFELEILSGQDLQERQWTKDLHSDFSKLEGVVDLTITRKTSQVDENNTPPTAEEQVIIDNYNKEIRKLKATLPDFYVHKKMNFILLGFSQAFPSPKKIFEQGVFHHFEGDKANLKSLYILCKARISINDKMYALSEYLTWTYQDYQTDPVERMKGSTITIIHQDRYLVDDMMMECANIFEKALLWDEPKEDLSVLKDRVSYFRYIFGNAMVVTRGSATIGENFEKLMYRVYDLLCIHNPKTLGDMEGFIAPMWPSFRKVYDSTITLEKQNATQVGRVMFPTFGKAPESTILK